MAGRYGDVMRVDTTGASAKTSNDDNQPVQGVAASHRMAQHDLPQMNRYKHTIQRVGRSEGVDPAVIAGVMSRESRAGTGLKNGWGDHGNAYGLMQVDKNYHTPQGRWDSEEHITQATRILVSSINDVKRNHPDWSQEQCLKGGLAAYNKGPNAVKSYREVDAQTTDRDYSNDVVARAQFYKSQGY
ncbi:lysozyme g-like [Megalops cyprinoides]|uniref:lysozyme g-like n=1 Tax=Megalops cyprinoides TaxID=118141 RepID=UPI001864B2A5|nr:lysozyme g-like [Megalops cyprinoides]